MSYKSRFQPLELFRAGSWQISQVMASDGDISRGVPMRFVDNPT